MTHNNKIQILDRPSHLVHLLRLGCVALKECPSQHPQSVTLSAVKKQLRNNNGCMHTLHHYQTLSQLHHKDPYAASHCSRSPSSNWASSPNSICIGHATRAQTPYWKMMKCLSHHLNHDVATARTLILENLDINKSTGPQMTVGREGISSSSLSKHFWLQNWP